MFKENPSQTNLPLDPGAIVENMKHDPAIVAAVAESIKSTREEAGEIMDLQLVGYVKEGIQNGLSDIGELELFAMKKLRNDYLSSLGGEKAAENLIWNQRVAVPKDEEMPDESMTPPYPHR